MPLAAIFVLFIQKDVRIASQLSFRAARVGVDGRDDMKQVVILRGQSSHVTHPLMVDVLALSKAGALGPIQSESRIDTAEKMIRVESHGETQSWRIGAGPLTSAQANAGVIEHLTLVINDGCAKQVVTHQLNRRVEKRPILGGHDDPKVMQARIGGSLIINLIQRTRIGAGRRINGRGSLMIDANHVKLNDRSRCLWRNRRRMRRAIGRHGRLCPRSRINRIPERQSRHSVLVRRRDRDGDRFARVRDNGRMSKLCVRRSRVVDLRRIGLPGRSEVRRSLNRRGLGQAIEVEPCVQQIRSRDPLGSERNLVFFAVANPHPTRSVLECRLCVVVHVFGCIRGDETQHLIRGVIRIHDDLAVPVAANDPPRCCRFSRSILVERSVLNQLDRIGRRILSHAEIVQQDLSVR